MDYQADDRGYAEERNGDRYDNQDAGRDRERSRSPIRDRDGDVRVRDSSPRRNSAPRDAPPPEDEAEAQNTGTNLFVTGIHPRLREEEIQEKFEKYGNVVSCNIMRDPHTRESRGFGFIQMETLEAADAAKEALQGEDYEGRTLSIEKARRGKPRGPTPGKYFGPPKREDFRGGRRDDRRGGGGGYRDDYRRGPPGGYGRPYDSYGRDDRYGGGRDRGYGGGGYGRDDRYGGRGDRDYGRGGGYESRPPRDDYDSRAARGPAGEDRYR